MRLVLNSISAALLLAFASGCRKPVVGCMDAAYINYDQEANEDNGCCCTIERGEQDGAQVDMSFALAFPNVPEPAPMIALQASVKRMDQTAKGPCGCLRYQGSWGGNASYDGLYSSQDHSYSSGSGTYGPRSVCYTYVSWLLRPSAEPIDPASWNLIAAANGLDSIMHPLLINYTMRFSASGLNDFVMHYSDTLRAAMHPNTSSGLYLSWGSSWYLNPRTTHRISGTELPCTDYPIDNAGVIIDSVNIGFLP